MYVSQVTYPVDQTRRGPPRAGGPWCRGPHWLRDTGGGVLPPPFLHLLVGHFSKLVLKQVRLKHTVVEYKLHILVNNHVMQITKHSK